VRHVIDSDGFRANVGIIVCNASGALLWARRMGQDAWQFPQGGIQGNESPEQAMYRELDEEVGLQPGDVRLLGRTRGWLHYRLPPGLIRRRQRPVCIGQKQAWFLLRLTGWEHRVRLDCSASPEFDRWCWIDYWRPAREVVDFKRQVYGQALEELAPLLAGDGDRAADARR